jgi:hypothetical protein
VNSIEARDRSKERALSYYSYLWGSLAPVERGPAAQVAHGGDAATTGSDGLHGAAPGKWARGPWPPKARRSLSRYSAAWATNAEMATAAGSGAARSGLLSEWPWTLVYRHGKRYRLFSRELCGFVVAASDGTDAISSSGLVLDLIRVLDDNLRRHCGKAPPSGEREVQSAIQLTPDASGREYRREGHGFPFGLMRWRPDHISEPGTAAGARLCTGAARCRSIVGEVSAGILPYRSRYGAAIAQLLRSSTIPAPPMTKGGSGGILRDPTASTC